MKFKIPQKKIKGLGAIMESLYNALPLLSIINFLSIIIVLYSNIRGDLTRLISWMNLGWFFAIIAVLTIIATILTWVFLVPSIWALRGQQLNEHSDIFKKGKEKEDK